MCCPGRPVTLLCYRRRDTFESSPAYTVVALAARGVPTLKRVQRLLSTCAGAGYVFPSILLMVEFGAIVAHILGMSSPPAFLSVPIRQMIRNCIGEAMATSIGSVLGLPFSYLEKYR